jgi:hypothetical protein
LATLPAFSNGRWVLYLWKQQNSLFERTGPSRKRIIRERALDAEASVLNALTEEVTRPLRDVEGDESGCQAIFAVNETHSSEAYYCWRTWRRTERDPRVYYPELNTDRAGDPRTAAVGCTGEAQENNRQLVFANLIAAALASICSSSGT